MVVLYQLDLRTGHFTGTHLCGIQDFLNLLGVIFLELLDFRELCQEPLLDIQKHDNADGTIMAEFRTLTAQDKKEKIEGSTLNFYCGYKTASLCYCKQ